MTELYRHLELSVRMLSIKQFKYNFNSTNHQSIDMDGLLVDFHPVL